MTALMLRDWGLPPPSKPTGGPAGHLKHPAATFPPVAAGGLGVPSRRTRSKVTLATKTTSSLSAPAVRPTRGSRRCGSRPDCRGTATAKVPSRDAARNGAAGPRMNRPRVEVVEDQDAVLEHRDGGLAGHFSGGIEARPVPDDVVRLPLAWLAVDVDQRRDFLVDRAALAVRIGGVVIGIEDLDIRSDSSCKRRCCRVPAPRFRPSPARPIRRGVDSRRSRPW